MNREQAGDKPAPYNEPIGFVKNIFKVIVQSLTSVILRMIFRFADGSK